MMLFIESRIHIVECNECLRSLFRITLALIYIDYDQFPDPPPAPVTVDTDPA